MPTYIGTGYFSSESSAKRHCDDAALKEGRAIVGRPKTNPGESLELRDGRYHIVVPDAVAPPPDTPMLAHLKPETVEIFPAGSFKESGTSTATRVIQILK